MTLLTILASEAPNGKFLPGDVKEFWWGLVAFSVVVGLLIWKLAPIIRNALSKAQAKAVDEASAAETAVLDARTRIAAATEQLSEANTETERILAEARTTAQNLRVDSANRTQQLVNDMWAKAQSDAESMKAQASSDISAEVAGQAVGAAEEVVRSRLDDARHAELIESYISSLAVSS